MTAVKISYFVSSLFIEINYTHDGNVVHVFICALTRGVRPQSVYPI